VRFRTRANMGRKGFFGSALWQKGKQKSKKSKKSETFWQFVENLCYNYIEVNLI
jgi:hypothetical protein